MSTETPPPERDDQRQYKKIRRGEIAVRVALVAGAIGTSLVLLAVLYIVVLIRSSQVTNTSTNQQLTTLSAAIESCLNPDGACAQRNAQHEQAVLGNISDRTARVVAYGLICYQNPQLRHSLPGLTACIEHLVRRDNLDGH